MKQNRKITILFFIILIIISISVVPKTLQNDTFYTIAIGNDILKYGIDGVDHYSWHEDLPYTYPHWLYDITIATIFNNWGFTGIYISTILLSIMLGTAMYFTITKVAANRPIAMLASVIAIIGLGMFLTARAQLVTYILFVLEIYCIERLLETKHKRYIVYLILISILVSNLHIAVWPVLLLLMLPYIAEHIIAHFRPNDIKEHQEKEQYKVVIEKNNNVKLLVITAILVILAGMINPTGEGPFSYIVNSMTGGTLDIIEEHKPLVLMQSVEFIVFLIVAFSILLFTNVKIRLRDLFMLFGLIFLSFYSQRQISICIIVSTIILAKLAYQFVKMHSKEDELSNMFSSRMGLGCILCLSVAIAMFNYSERIGEKIVDETLYPVNATQYVLDNYNIHDIKMFNNYTFGSYLLYKGIPVYIDSRSDLYTTSFNKDRDIFAEYVSVYTLQESYDSTFEKYGITHVLMYKEDIINFVLQKDAAYKIVYEDESFILWEKV